MLYLDIIKRQKHYDTVAQDYRREVKQLAEDNLYNITLAIKKLHQHN